MDYAKLYRIADDAGFIAALDQSGGSTPKALKDYGLAESDWSTEEDMFALVHKMRTRIMKSPGFRSDRVIGAILFERTMDGDVDGTATADYLWENRGVVPFLKIDKGLEAPADGVRMMKPIANVDALLERAVSKGIFGTKMRSVIDAASPSGIAANVAQQFELGHRILAHGLVPILEPEVTISIADKAEAETILRKTILEELDRLPEGRQVMLKLSLPSESDFYKPLIDHPRVLRVLALSGGYSRHQANAILARNAGLIGSFSRALVEGLSAQQLEAEFDAVLAAAIESIYEASTAG